MNISLNLDQKAAQYAQIIVKEAKPKELGNMVTKALGVLQEQGVYALMLFLLSRSEKALCNLIINNLNNLLIEISRSIGELPAPNSSERDTSQPANILKFYSDRICEDLDMLFLVRDVFEQTLIYARYGAKAKEKRLNSQVADNSRANQNLQEVPQDE